MGKILIVEDEEALKRIFFKALTSLADEVLLANEGEEALSILENNNDIELIISDWMMPGMDGSELLLKVKSNENLSNIPFIMLTAKDNIDDVVASLNNGADDYLRKPCQISEIIARAQNLIKTKRSKDVLLNQAIRDSLTDLYNHKYFKETLAHEVERVERYSGELSLLVVDIDHFKNFNDTYGHQLGDKVIKQIAQIIVKTMRSVDISCRYGGEEFAVILPGTDGEKAIVAAERLLSDVRESEIKKNEEIIKITVSVGISSYTEKDTPETLFKRTDKALYEAKDTGRNRMCRH